MKKFIFCLSLFLGISYANAQDIQIFNDKGVNISGDTLFLYPKYCAESFEQFEIKDLAKIFNNTNMSMTIGLKRHERNVRFGTGDAVCWGSTCFGEKPAGTDPIWDVADSAIALSKDTAGGLGFVVYHFPNKNTGNNTYLYEFYNRANPTISDSVYVQFVVETTPDSIVFKNKAKKSILSDTVVVNAQVDLLDPSQKIELSGVINIINQSCVSNDLGLRRVEHTVVNGTGDAVCWGDTCYNEITAGSRPTWDVEDSVFVRSKDEAKFSILHYPNLLTGESLYEYQVYDKKNPGVISSVYVKLITTVKPAQIRFVASNKEYQDGDTLTFSAVVDKTTTQEVELTSPFNVYNYSVQAINIGVSREEVAIVNGTEELFCWADSCSSKALAGTNSLIDFPKTISVPSKDSVIGANVFKMKLYPNDNRGTAIYKYNFYDFNDLSNTSTIYIKYNLEAATGVGENNIANSDFIVYPNPAKDKLFLSYTNARVLRNHVIVIQDLLGNVVIRKNVNDLTKDLAINLTGIESGIYFITLSDENNSRLTKKLIVK